MPQGGELDDADEMTEKHDTLAELRFLFFDFAPPGFFISQLLHGLAKVRLLYVPTPYTLNSKPSTLHPTL